jgi:hypothetical protein
MPKPLRDLSGLSEAQARKVLAKHQYDLDRYSRNNKWRAKYGSPEHLEKMSKKALARRKSSGHAALTRLIGTYTWNAKVRGVPFDLSREDFARLVSLPCHYCGEPPSAVKQGKDIWSPLVYNGVDRVDNEKGYSLSNSVACCKNCNAAKRNLSVQEFLAWVEKIYLQSIQPSKAKTSERGSE